MDRAGPPPLRLSPAVRSGARAPRPPRPDRTDGRAGGRPLDRSFHPCMHASPHGPRPCGVAWPSPSSRLSRSRRRGRARTTRPRQGRRAALRSTACHVATTEHASHLVVAHAPVPRRRSHRRRPVPNSHGQNGAKPQKPKGNGASGRQPANKVAALFRSFPLGFGNPPFLP